MDKACQIASAIPKHPSGDYTFHRSSKKGLRFSFFEPSGDGQMCDVGEDVKRI